MQRVNHENVRPRSPRPDLVLCALQGPGAVSPRHQLAFRAARDGKPANANIDTYTYASTSQTGNRDMSLSLRIERRHSEERT